MIENNEVSWKCEERDEATGGQTRMTKIHEVRVVSPEGSVRLENVRSGFTRTYILPSMKYSGCTI
jgi:hypothetical protein